MYDLTKFTVDPRTEEYVDIHGNRRPKEVVDEEEFKEYLRRCEVQLYLNENRISSIIK